MHAPPSVLRVLMMERYWTKGEAALVKRANQNFEECNKHRNKRKFEYEPNDPLPDQINEKGIPFKVIGIDCAGPVLNKHNEKRYFMIVICVYTKKIRLEMTESLSIKSRILALMRVKAREKDAIKNIQGSGK